MGFVRKKISLAELAKALRNITPEARAEIKIAVTKAALLVERDAKINAPVDTGTLRNSISHRITESNGLYEAEVGASVDYSDYQEYGTGRRGANSNVIAPSSYEYGNSQGIPAHPFLGPALLKNRVKIQELINTAVKKALQR
jgi:HK97 gp10 family phage protein